MHLIEIPFDMLDAWVLYETHWRQHYEMDANKKIHSPELYAIWAQKAFFVKRAIAENPFHTEFFYWCDVGAFRDPNIPTEILQTFPQAEKLPRDQILLNSVHPFTQDDMFSMFHSLFSNYHQHICRIVGGLWGGHRDACLLWTAAYEQTLVRFFANDCYAGNDQMVMLMTYILDPTLAVTVKPFEDYTKDNWFFQEYALSALNTRPLQIDTSFPTRYPDFAVTANLKGGLGNQLFQIAAAYAYAKKHACKLAFMPNKQIEDGRPMYWDTILHRFTSCVGDIRSIPFFKWAEQEPTQYKPIVSYKDLHPSQRSTFKGLFIDGYVQSSKYFEDAATRQEIRMLFRPSAAALLDVRTRYGDLLAMRERVVVVHARRTDYLKSQHNIDFHGPLTAEYYRKALERIQTNVSNPVFLLCSDDPTYWTTILSEVPALLTHPFHILNEPSEVATLTLLQQFSHFVLANSTFSWWAAWLSESPRCVIAPAKWFGPAGPAHYEDIYEPDWIRV